ncbi:MAG: lipocalin family protein [Victivallales bacterium]|nr:lipocalin family protein [Victivallales bacterium]
MKILTILMVALLAGCASAPKVDNSVVKSFKLEPYLGVWYEIARFDHTFERGVQEAKATYSLRPDGKVSVLNSGMKGGKPKTAKGTGKTTATPGLLRVTFFWPFYADYRVMAIDEDYSAALVGSGNANYLWILSRTPQLDLKMKEALLSEARRRGYDTSKFIWVQQGNN